MLHVHQTERKQVVRFGEHDNIDVVPLWTTFKVQMASHVSIMSATASLGYYRFASTLRWSCISFGVTQDGSSEEDFARAISSSGSHISASTKFFYAI